MQTFARIGMLLAGIALLALVTGCASISDSVTSPSRWVADSSEAIADSSGASADSSNNSSQSSSGSSSDDESSDESAYQEDVRVATRTLAAAGEIGAQLPRELSRIALDHGISDWESHAGTWIAVGAGLREAGLSQAEAQDALVRVGRVTPRERDLMAEGYRAEL